MSLPIDPDFEATVARAMLAELEAYLRSDVLFWQVAPSALGSRMPKMTIGGLLEALLRAEAAGVSVRPLRSTLETVQAQHRARYLARAEQEAGSRLNTWARYQDDYLRAPAEAAGDYPNEVRTRFKAELLLAELERGGRGQAERRRATSLDERLRADWQTGAFVWDERLKPLLPPDRFWWLYGRLRD